MYGIYFSVSPKTKESNAMSDTSSAGPTQSWRVHPLHLVAVVIGSTIGTVMAASALYNDVMSKPSLYGRNDSWETFDPADMQAYLKTCLSTSKQIRIHVGGYFSRPDLRATVRSLHGLQELAENLRVTGPSRLMTIDDVGEGMTIELIDKGVGLDFRGQEGERMYYWSLPSRTYFENIADEPKFVTVDPLGRELTGIVREVAEASVDSETSP